MRKKINTVVFGLTGLDTADIVREMRTRDAFNIVAWFGLFEDATHNTYDFYEFKVDYDCKTNVPEALFFELQKELFYFVDNDIRRSNIKNHWRQVFLKDLSLYESLDHYHRYIYYVWDLLTKNNVELVIIDGIPHCSGDLVLAKIAQYLGIKLMMLYPAPFPNKFMYFTEFINNGVDFDEYSDRGSRPIRSELVSYPLEKREKLFYMSIVSPEYMDNDTALMTKDDSKWLGQVFTWDLFNLLNRALKPSLSKVLGVKRVLNKLEEPNSTYQKPYKPTAYNFRKLWLDMRWDFRKHIKSRNFFAIFQKLRFLNKFLDYKEYRRTLNAAIDKEYSLNVPYVYFPLHFQPELTTQCQANQIYVDQALAIERTASIIPDDWFIYVKEHPIQSELCRPDTFYERLKGIPNLKIVPIETNTFELIDHCQFVSTISGTVGWEAVKNDKNVLLFGNYFYQSFPGVFRYHDNFDYQKLLQYKIDPQELQAVVERYIARCEDGVASAEYSKWVPDYDSKHNAKLVTDFFEQFIEVEMLQKQHLKSDELISTIH